MKTLVHSYRLNWFDRFCLWYPPGWLILFNRHWQHYHPDPDGWNWLEYGLFLIPGGFYLALLIRWFRLGCRSPQPQGYQFDPGYQQAFRDEVLSPIVRHHFRAELHQIENLPQTGPLIVAMNHAGMCFPWDFLGLADLLSQTRGWVVQPLAGTSLFEHPWMVWWLPPGWSQTLGGVRAELDDFEAAIAQKTILLYAPEGLRGPGKGWQKRYQLAGFHPSFIRLSDRHHVPILPVVCTGNESLHPWAVNLRQLARRFQLPFLPLSMLMIVFVLFPSMGVWAMRTDLRYYIQPLDQTRPTDPAKVDHSSNSTAPQVTRSIVYQRAKILRERMQCRLNEILSS